MRILALLLLTAMPAMAAPAERPIVVELFTSQGCSSCPPADALLAELGREGSGLLPLGFHITYWDRLGWRDPYALAAATQRQQDARARFGLDYVYTPQLIVDGRHQAVGSDRSEVRAAIAAARAAAATVPLAVSAREGALRIEVGAGPGAAGPSRGQVLLIGFDAEHMTPVRAGENSGRTLREVNVVRSIVPAASWSGAAAVIEAARPAGERVAALLQAPDGRIVGAALLP